MPSARSIAKLYPYGSPRLATRSTLILAAPLAAPSARHLHGRMTRTYSIACVPLAWSANGFASRLATTLAIRRQTTATVRALYNAQNVAVVWRRIASVVAKREAKPFADHARGTQAIEYVLVIRPCKCLADGAARGAARISVDLVASLGEPYGYSLAILRALGINQLPGMRHRGQAIAAIPRWEINGWVCADRITAGCWQAPIIVEVDIVALEDARNIGACRWVEQGIKECRIAFCIAL